MTTPLAHRADHKYQDRAPVEGHDGAESLRHVVIVGGGIAGLSTAWYLRKAAREAGIELQITVLESSDRWGGKIRTETIAAPGTEPFVVEAGPDSFITQKPWGLQLARELGLSERLLGTNDHMRRVFVLNHGKPTPLPDGVLLIVPTKLRPFALSSLISPLGKLRMGLDLLLPPKRDGRDETIAEFIQRRLGSEALEKIAEPLMSGIYNAEAEKQSLLATFPRFRAIEEEYGSLIRGMIAARKKHPAPQPSAEPKTTLFTSLRAGTEELVHALVAQVEADLRLNSHVARIERSEVGEYHLMLASGETLHADAVILATPAYMAAALIKDLAPLAAEGLESIRYVSTGTLSLAFRRSEIRHPLDGFGLVIPRSEKRPINAVTWSSTKFNHRAPEDHVLLRVFFGGSRHPEMMQLNDENLLNIVRSELEVLMGISAEPAFHRIYRWQRANPQYDTGHLERVDAIEAALPEGIYVTGSPYRGIGIPDCVYQAQNTAKGVLDGLRSRTNQEITTA